MTYKQLTNCEVKTKRTLSLLLLGIAYTLNAQQATITSGGKASGLDGSVNYTVGQAVYAISKGAAGSIVQGVQQPYEVSVVSGIEVKSITLECSVYPNPTTDFLRLKLQDYNVVNLTYQLFDINGIQILCRKVDGSDNEISLQNYQNGTYFLKVIRIQSANNQQEIKTFKIIKN